MMDKRKKTIFRLDSPFTSSQRPELSIQEQNTILEILINLLAPVGQWRFNNTTPSKGKRDKKRKRKAAKSGDIQLDDTKAPLPEITSFLRVGLNSVSRTLQYSSNASNPSTNRSTKPTSSEPFLNAEYAESSETTRRSNHQKKLQSPYLAAVFVARQSHLSALDTHLAQLIATSTLAHPELPTPRLVQLPPGSDAKLCEVLGVARVSMVGLLDGAPHSSSLIELARRCVPEVEIPWLREARKAEYLPVKVNAIETSIGPAKEKRVNVAGKKSSA